MMVCIKKRNRVEVDMKQKKQIMTVNEYRRLISDTPKENRKVKNAQRCERDGRKFASRLERDMCGLLEMFKIPFEFQKKYVLQDGFIYNGEKVQAITYTTDFYLPTHDTVIDTKGFQTQQGMLRIKMLKKRFAEAGLHTEILLPATPVQCETVINRLIGNDR